MSISDMNNTIGNMLTSTYDSYDAAADKVSGALNKNYNSATDEELINACKQFESYFYEQVFKGMEKMVPKSESQSSYLATMTDFYKDELISKYAAMATERSAVSGNGNNSIAMMLYEQMKRNVE